MYRKNTIEKYKHFDLILNFIALFFIFFPWLSFGLNNLDTQPWVIITNTLYIFIYSKRKIKKFLLFGYVLLIIIFIISLVDFGELSLRGFLTYFVFFSTLHVLYICFEKFYNYFLYLLPKFNIIWLLSGAMQAIFGKYVLSFLVTVRTSDDRGVTGLAPEPTHYAFFLMFMSWLLLITTQNKDRKKNTILIVMNILFILFVAKSSMVFFYCILFTMFVLFSYLSMKQMLKLIPLATLFSSIVLIFILNDSDSRISHIVNQFFNNPLYIIRNDASINARLSAPVLSIYSSIKDLFIPHGFNSYSQAVVVAMRDLNGLFEYGYSAGKIMSGTGSVLYELGWIGIILIMLSYYIMSYKLITRKAFIPFILLWIFLLGAIPMSFTLIPAILVAYYFNNAKLIATLKRI